MDAQGGAADPWSSGQDYELYVGRWSSAVARDFVPWMDAPPGANWLDVGCGTGALSEAILRYAEPTRLHGVDSSSAFIDLATHRLSGTIATFSVGNAMRLDDADDTHDAVASALVLTFLPDAATAIAEQVRVTVPGGVVGAYIWDYASGMQLMRYFWDAVVEVDPSAADQTEGARNAEWQPYHLERLFADAGLTGVETREFIVPTPFPSFDDYWSPFLGGQGSAPAFLRTRGEEFAAAVRAQLERTVPAAPDGSISLTARAWAVKGLRRWPLKSGVA